MAYQQTPTRANIEFLKSSKGCGGRVIRLAGASSPQLIPQQLQGRMDPVGLALGKAPRAQSSCSTVHLHALSRQVQEWLPPPVQATWAQFMGQVQHLADIHP